MVFLNEFSCNDVSKRQIIRKEKCPSSMCQHGTLCRPRGIVHQWNISLWHPPTLTPPPHTHTHTHITTTTTKQQQQHQRHQHHHHHARCINTTCKLFYTRRGATMPPLLACADPESFVRGGPILTSFFVDEGKREDPNNTKSGPLSAHLRNAIWMTFRWQADDGLTLNAGLIALWFFRGSGKPYIFVIFQGG